MNCEDLLDYDLVYHWRDLVIKPKIIVLDLDHTLWPFYVDTNPVPPFTKHLIGKQLTVTDSTQTQLMGYADIPKILNTLTEYCFNNGEQIAIASRSRRQDLAMNLIELFNWKKYFNSFQIYSLPKNNHLFAIKNELKCNDFGDMLFFDDNKYNVNLATDMGVCSYLVDKNIGLNFESVHRALDIFDHARFKK